MDDPIGLLRELGFGDYEARAYVALLQRSPLNGYELAKASGIPRPNIYPILRKLEEQGAVLRVDTASGTRYAPVPPLQLTRQLGHRFQGHLEAAQRTLQGVSAPAEYEHVWNAQGYATLLERGRAAVDAAEKQVLVALWPDEAAALASSFSRAEERGVTFTTLCLEACPVECGGCRGRIYRYRAAPEMETRWLVLVADEHEVLAGEIGAAGEAQVVGTRQRLLVEVAGWYIRHSIALAAVLGDIGGRLEHLLRPETQAMLASAGPAGQSAGWLEHMRRLLGRRPGSARAHREG